METPALPRGWKREEFSRPRGLSNGKYQVHYINELGQRFKNKCMLARFMGGEVDLTPFDWRTGKIDPFLKRKVERMMKVRECPDVNRRLRNDHTIKPPLRQTVSNFRLPVTIYRNQPKEAAPMVPPTNSVMTRQVQNQIIKANNHEQQRAALAAAEAKTNNLKPRQIFWEKRLQGQQASIYDENYEKFSLPQNIKPLIPEHISDDSVVRAIVASLYDRNTTVTLTGQANTSQDVKKNPAIFLDPYQPPTHYISVDDNDLKRQEERVKLCRKELDEAIKSVMEQMRPAEVKVENDKPDIKDEDKSSLLPPTDTAPQASPSSEPVDQVSTNETQDDTKSLGDEVTKVEKCEQDVNENLDEE